MTNTLGTFEYRLPDYSATEPGWIKLNNIKTSDAKVCAPPVVCEALTPADVRAGFYGARVYGGVGEKRNGAPETWVFIVAPGIKRPRFDWVDPDRFEAYTSTLEAWR